jgi:mannan endo-1,4-beta-mannosidase
MGGFDGFQGQFYKSQKAQEIYQRHLDRVLNRKNTITGRIYNQDATIMTWEPINEPQLADKGSDGKDVMIAWHNGIAEHIKSVAPLQLVTTGFEAKQGLEAFKEMHESKHIDYGCAHMWPQIWGAYNMLDPSKENIDKAIKWAKDYVLEVESYARVVGKPILLEEFGMPRDNWHNNVSAGTYLVSVCW